MSSRIRIAFLSAALAVFLGCAAAPTTNLTTTWSNPQVKGPLQFKKVLVLAVSKDMDIRRQTEGYLTVLLPKAEGVPAYMAIPDSDLRDKAKVKEILKSNGFDGAIVVRLVSASQETRWVDDGYMDFWGYYDWAWPYVNQPGYLVTENKYRVETRIYALDGFRQVWSGLSVSFDPASLQQFIKELADAVKADLKAKGLVA
jgi:hypothetical protein